MTEFWNTVNRELAEQRMLRPIFLSLHPSHRSLRKLLDFFPNSRLCAPGETNLMGRDVVLVHAGEYGWEELLLNICRESPARLFVVAPECPSTEALRLEWVADKVILGAETYQYEVAMSA